MDGWAIARKDRINSEKRIRYPSRARTSRVRSLRSPAKPALDLRARCGSLAIMASGETARRSPNKSRKKKLQKTTALDFVPSWVGQLHDNLARRLEHQHPGAAASAIPSVGRVMCLPPRVVGA